MMTTATLLLLAGLAVVVIAAANLFLWGVEFLAALVRYMAQYFMSKPHDFTEDYINIRIFFTRGLNHVSFAMMTHKQILKYYAQIHDYDKKQIEKKKQKYVTKVNQIDDTSRKEDAISKTRSQTKLPPKKKHNLHLKHLSILKKRKENRK